MVKRCMPWLLGAALLTSIPTRVLAQANCGPFADVLASDPFCPFILEAFDNGITSGTSTTTFSPGNTVTRNQMVVFFDKGVDLTLHRGTVRTAMGKTWFPSSTSGAVVTDAGGAINDIVTDGINLWIARADSKILKVSAADRRLLETWTIPAGSPRKLGYFVGLVWIADNLGNLYYFNPSNPAGSAILALGPSAGVAVGNYPALAFDGTNIWWGNAAGATILTFSLGSTQVNGITAPSNVDGLVFDGTNMWLLLASSVLAKATLPTAAVPLPAILEALTLPGAVNPCKMLYDGSNIWFASGVASTLYVVHPTTTSPSVLPSSIILNAPVSNVVSFPYAIAFDGENVMIGGLNNGAVALYKATTQTLLGAFATGASSVLGIASEGRTFNFGDAGGTKFFQY
jgi:hypothetical protein